MQGKLIKRYKRFFMDVSIGDEVITAHVPNTGSLLGLLNPQTLVLLKKSNDPKRKLSYTVEAIFFNNAWVGINTQTPNRLIKENILKHELFLDLHHYKKIQSEVPYGLDKRSRIDIKLTESLKKEPDIYIEIKNVTMMRDNIAYFPDAKTLRGQKHIDDLLGVIKEGHRAMLLFLVQREDCKSFSPAVDIDPIYAEKLIKAKNKGLEIKIISAKVNESGVYLKDEIKYA